MSNKEIFSLKEFKLENSKKYSLIKLQAFVSKIPSSNVRLIPIKHSNKWTLSFDYRNIRDSISKRIKKEMKKKQLKFQDWAKGVLFLDYFRKGTGFTRDIDNFLKIIIDGVFTGLGLNDNLLRMIKVFLREKNVELEGRKKILGVEFKLLLIFKKMTDLEKELDSYEKFFYE